MVQGGMNVVRIHATTNESIADAIRDHADQVERQPKPVLAYAVVTVLNAGKIGVTYANASHAYTLVGALEDVKLTILESSSREEVDD